MRIGVLKEGFGHPNSEKDVDDLVRECTKRLAKVSGASVEEISIPWHLDGKEQPLYFPTSVFFSTP